MTGALCSALLAAAAVWAMVPPPARLRSTRPRIGVAARWPAALLLAGAVLASAGILAGLSGLLWALAGLVLSGTLAGLAAAHRAERARARAAADVERATRVVAGQLLLGALPGAALSSAALDNACMERPAAVRAIGGDVSAALRREGTPPGREGLVSLARAWELCERTGAPIASLAEQVSEQVAAERASRRLVAQELAGPRATARMLALLPLAGMAMGSIAGGDPVGFLAGTLPGQACLTGGVVLACAGVLWTEAMARRAEGVGR